MPLDTGASFIVVQHLSPDSVSMMDKILQKSVKMPVRLAEENMELRPNEIYLNIPGMMLEVESGRCISVLCRPRTALCAHQPNA